MSTRVAMDEQTFLDFYRRSVSCYSKKAQSKICKKLVKDGLITFDLVMDSRSDNQEAIYFEKNDPETILSTITRNRCFMGFFEHWEYIKLYKYSVPLFYESDARIKDVLSSSKIKKFTKNEFSTDYVLRTNIQDAEPMWYEEDGKCFIKFVLQKTFIQGENFEQIDYRYPIIIYFDEVSGILEIRYDSVKLNYRQVEVDVYANLVGYCIKWLTETIGVDVYYCEHSNTIDVVNDKTNSSVRMYKQMMDLKSGGSAELKAAEGRDAVLPFVGELRELIDENEELFNKASEIKALLVNYLNDIEVTASYPYIYVKWENAVESQSYIVKITFDYLRQTYTVLQHLTGTCNDLGMERMNNAIRYLCESGSFTKGEQIKY